LSSTQATLIEERRGVDVPEIERKSHESFWHDAGLWRTAGRSDGRSLL